MIKEHALVLNKSWSAIRVENVVDSLRKVFTGAANLLDEETYTPYSWEDWMDKFSIDRQDNPAIYGYEFITTCSRKIRLPKMIVLNEYDKVPRKEIKLTRKNLLIRDNYTCQYTGKKLSYSESTIDHVMPTSRGGKNDWPNVVIAAKDINVKKGNKTPEEAGLTLLRKPKKPHWHPLYAFIHNNKDKYSCWNRFLKI